MSSEDIYLTRQGYEKLTEELETLKTVQRRKLSKAIAEARAHGDISENAEYDAAKEAQGQNEGKIAELEFQLSHARIIEHEDMPRDEILIGAKARLQDLETQEELEYTFVSEIEADYSQSKISVTSPIGRALLGHKEGEIVEINIPAGVLKYKVLKILRE